MSPTATPLWERWKNWRRNRADVVKQRRARTLYQTKFVNIEPRIPPCHLMCGAWVGAWVWVPHDGYEMDGTLTRWKQD